MDTPGQYVFGKDMLSNLASFVDWKVANDVKQRQVDIDNVRKIRAIHACYAIGDQVYVEMIGLYRKLDYKKQVPYIINEFFTYGIVQF